MLDDRPPQDRASTVPEDDAIPVAMPRTDTKNGPSVAPRLARSPSQGERLIVPRDETNLANDLLDEAFDGLSREAVKTFDGPGGAMRPPARPAKLPLPAPIDEREVVMEADEPPTLEKGPSQIASKKARAIGDQSEPEISIERFFELEVEEPMNETGRTEDSPPEIMILTPGRAITADDTQSVSGSIESAEPAAKKS